MKKRLPLFISFILFVALAASAAYWFQEFKKPPARTMVAPPEQATDLTAQDAAGLFGGHQVAAASNFQLKGVVAARQVSDGVALLVADGKPTQAVKVGAEVVPGVSLKEVHPQYVLLSDGGVLKRIDLPEIRTLEATISQPEAPQGGSRMTGPRLPTPLVGGKQNQNQDQNSSQAEPPPPPEPPQGQDGLETR
jgi:general secretion pathway protein C